MEIKPIVTGQIMSHIESLCLFPPNDNTFANKAFGNSYDANFKWVDGRTGAVSIPVYSWYIKDKTKKIIVDTSLDYRVSYGEGVLIKEEWKMPAQLSKLGIKPEDIDIVINTHLHNDHMGNNDIFTKAKFIIQSEEIPLIFAPKVWMSYYFKDQTKCIINVKDRIYLVDGDEKISENLSVWKLGGHTPGSQAVIIEGEKKVAIAGDVVPTFFNIEQDWPTGIFWDINGILRGMTKLRNACDLVLPSHDWKVISIYPQGINI